PGTHLVDWSNASPGPIMVTDATAYELFAVGAFDLGGTGVVLHFGPTGLSTYDVTQAAALAVCTPPASYPALADGPMVIGVGCPPAVPNGSLYELFTTDAGTSPLDTQGTSVLFVAGGETYFTIPGTGLDPSYTTGTVLSLGDEQFVNLSLGAMGAFPFGDLVVTDINLSSN